MKSFVSQGKNILDAIDKALILADFPKNFTIKILEVGERSFLWWRNKTAVILFFYEDTADVSCQNNKKRFKKNYSKEEAFVNKKVINQFVEPEYTSVIKHDKSNNENFSNKSTKNNNIEKQINSKDNRQKADSSMQKSIKNSDIEKSISVSNEPQSLLGAALQSKNSVNNNLDSGNSLQKKKTYHTRSNQDNNKILSDSLVFLEWKNEYILFVEKWLNELNKNFNFSQQPVKININSETLLIKVEDFQNCDFISKKYLFSSIVIILYDVLKINFKEFDNKSYKIVLE